MDTIMEKRTFKLDENWHEKRAKNRRFYGNSFLKSFLNDIVAVLIIFRWLFLTRI